MSIDLVHLLQSNRTWKSVLHWGSWYQYSDKLFQITTSVAFLLNYLIFNIAHLNKSFHKPVEKCLQWYETLMSRNIHINWKYMKSLWWFRNSTSEFWFFPSLKVNRISHLIDRINNSCNIAIIGIVYRIDDLEFLNLFWNRSHTYWIHRNLVDILY